MINSKIELLAPAGNKESFIGAINAGANAVYLAGKAFGARKFANNFSNEEIKELITYAHLRNVKVFVTVNTIIFEDEISDLLKYTDFLVTNYVDALIVQDIGMIHTMVKRYPNTEIHASTQMNSYNPNQIKYLKNIGVARVILARETPTDDIIKIKQKVDIDVEAFVHGALCVSYSGNCLFSAFNGGRSGNRGECAQPCRLPYTLLREDQVVNEKSYLMSTKDLMTIDKLDKILDSGVISLKIEGRMRSSEYVTATVRAYREAIDAYVNNQPFDVNTRLSELLTVFNREYTKGYISNETPYKINNSYRPNHQGVEVGKVINFNKGKTVIEVSDTFHVGDGIRIIGKHDIGGRVDKIVKDDWPALVAYKGDTITLDMPKQIEIGSIVRKTMDSKLNNELSKYIDPNYKLIPLRIIVDSFVGKELSISLKTPFSKQITLSANYTVQQANSRPQTKEKLIEQFSKFGNTFYNVTNIVINTDEQGFIPNSIINNLRRDAVSLLEETILTVPKREIIAHKETLDDISSNKLELIVKVETLEQYQVAKELGIKTIYRTDKVNGSNDDYLFMNRINDGSTPNHQNLVIQDFGLLDSNKNIITNEHLNVVNSKSIETLLKHNVQSITISEESTLENTRNMVYSFKNKHGFMPPVEVIVYTRSDLMITKYCPITKGEGINKLDCGICEKYQYYLKDTKKQQFPIIRDHKCNVRILHHKTYSNTLKLPKYLAMGIKRFRIDFSIESKEEVQRAINLFKKELY